MEILKPGQLGTLVLKNKIVFPPMVTDFGDADGFVTDKLVAYVEERAKGGVGLYILEASYVHTSGKAFPFGLGIDSQDKIPVLKRITNALHSHGAKASIQLHHGGRQTTFSLTGSPVLAPSDCPVSYSNEPVHVLCVEEIKEIVQAFIQGAVRAKEADFDMVTLHGAHGYLLSQFLSPYTNKRQDMYGGSLENRLRISLEIIKGIHDTLGKEFPISFRLSVDETILGGLTLQEGAQAAKILSESGINDIHVVTGNYATPIDVVPSCYDGLIRNRARCEAIRWAVGPDFCLTLAGRIKTVFQGEELIQSGVSNFVAMGRALIADPEMVKRCENSCFNSVRACIGCNEGCLNNTPITCALNPRVGHEYEYPLGEKAHISKKVLIIGAGPAGLESAYLAAQRGHKVVLCEKESSIGGQFLLAALPPHKEEIFLYLHNMLRRVHENNVDLRLSCNVNKEFILKEKPDYILLASGGKPIHIPFEGLDSIPYFTGHDVLAKDLDKLGEHVAVLGGGLVGCETAEFIATTGRKVSIIEMLPTLVESIHECPRMGLLSSLEKQNVALYPDHKVIKIIKNKIHTRTEQDKEEILGPFESVVISLGTSPNTNLENTLIELSIPYAKIGDCACAGNVINATSTALKAVWEI